MLMSGSPTFRLFLFFPLFSFSFYNYLFFLALLASPFSFISLFFLTITLSCSRWLSSWKYHFDRSPNCKPSGPNRPWTGLQQLGYCCYIGAHTRKNISPERPHVCTHLYIYIYVYTWNSRSKPPSSSASAPSLSSSYVRLLCRFHDACASTLTSLVASYPLRSVYRFLIVLRSLLGAADDDGGQTESSAPACGNAAADLLRGLPDPSFRRCGTGNSRGLFYFVPHGLSRRVSCLSDRSSV